MRIYFCSILEILFTNYKVKGYRNTNDICFVKLSILKIGGPQTISVNQILILLGR